MSSAENGKLVYVNTAQRDALEYLADILQTSVGVPLWQIVAAWDDAPADPAGAVRLALYNGHEDPVHGSVEGDEHDVLRALGVPPEREA